MTEPSPELIARASVRRSGAADPQPKPRKLTLMQMADLTERMAVGCTLMDRKVADKTTFFVDAQEAEDLKQVHAALRAMAPYADSIRRLLRNADQ